MLKKTLILLLILTVLPLAGGCGEKGDRFPGESALVYEVGDKFTINITDNPKKYLSCEVSLDITNKDDLTTLTEKNHWVRDIIIECIRTKTDVQLEAADAMQVLSEEIGTKISEKFNITSVFKVSFKEYFVYTK